MISAVAWTEEVATALVPIAVIPQIILGGVIAPPRDMARSLAEAVVSVYWGQTALERLLPDVELSRLGRGPMDWRAPLVTVLVHAGAVCVAASVVLWGRRGRGLT